jgi:hypothetical protein
MAGRNVPWGPLCHLAGENPEPDDRQVAPGLGQPSGTVGSLQA